MQQAIGTSNSALTIMVPIFVTLGKVSFRRGLLCPGVPSAILENWKSIGSSKGYGTLLSGLSILLDRILQELIITKLNTYGYTLVDLKSLSNHLPSRRQRTKISDPVSFVERSNFEDAKRIYMGPIFFKFFIMIC